MQFKRLKIINFGPIRDLELHFEHDKVYHFVADNDNGKSMIIDAMKAVCCNMPNNQIKKYVSDYADFFLIEAEDFEGNIIKLTRGQGLSEYYLQRADGTKALFDKAGVYVPEEIQKIVNVYVDSERDENFNIRTADDKAVFTNTTPSENYSYFQKALGTDRLRESIKINNKIVKTVKAENDITYGKVELEKSKLDDYVDLTEDKRKMDVYVTEVRKSYGILNQVTRLEDLNVLIEQEVAGLPSEIANLDKEKLYNEVRDIERMTELVDASTKYAVLKTETAKIEEIIQVNTEIKDLVSDLKLLNSYDELNNADEKAEKVINITESIDELSKGHSDIIREIQLLTKAIELDKAVELKDMALRRNEELIKEFTDLEKLKNDLQEVNKLTDALSNTRVKVKELNGVVEEVKVKRLELDSFMKKNKFCPVVVQREDMRCPFSNKRIEELGGMTG